MVRDDEVASGSTTLCALRKRCHFHLTMVRSVILIVTSLSGLEVSLGIVSLVNLIIESKCLLHDIQKSSDSLVLVIA